MQSSLSLLRKARRRTSSVLSRIPGVSTIRSHSKDVAPDVDEAGEENVKGEGEIRQLTVDAGTNGLSQSDMAELDEFVEKCRVEQNLDAGLMLLDSLDEDIDVSDSSALETEYERRELLLQVVTSRLARLVVKRHDEFVGGLQQVEELRREVEIMSFVCRKGRRDLLRAKKELEQGAGVIVTKFRQKEMAGEVIHVLHEVQALSEGIERIREALDGGHFATAVEQLDICKKAANAADGVAVTASFRKSIDEIEAQMEQRMTGSMSDIFRTFDEAKYERLISVSIDRHGLSHTVTSVFESFRDSMDAMLQKVVKSCILSKASEDVEGLYSRLNQESFEQLVSQLSDESFMRCAQGCFELLGCFTLSFRGLIAFHERGSLPEERDAAFLDEARQCAQTIWELTQEKAVNCLRGAKFHAWKLEKFLMMVSTTQKFALLAERASGRKASIIGDYVLQLSRSYYETLHRDCASFVREQLSMETWTPFPAAVDFSVSQLREVSAALQLAEDHADGAQGSIASSTSENLGASQFRFDELLSPGRLAEQSAEVTDGSTGPSLDGVSNSEEEDAAVHASSIVEESEGGEGADVSVSSEPVSTCVFTGTALSIAKFFGKYVQVLAVLRPIAGDAFSGITQLFEYYMHAVIANFVPPPDGPGMGRHIAAQAVGNGVSILESSVPGTQMSARLRLAVSRLKVRYSSSDTEMGEQGFGAATWPMLPLADFVDIGSSSSFYGVQERCVALESLEFLCDTLRELRPALLSLLPQTCNERLARFFAESVDACEELRTLVYVRFPHIMLCVERVHDLIARVKWDTKELGAEHNQYVNEMKRQLVAYMTRLRSLTWLPAHVSASQTRMAVEYMLEQLVDGYARIKKCSNEGRAMMSNDVSVCRKELEAASGLSPLPKLSHVMEYVTAFYMQESDLLAFARDHDEYSMKQVVALVTSNVDSVLKRKERSELVERLNSLRSG